MQILLTTKVLFRINNFKTQCFVCLKSHHLSKFYPFLSCNYCVCCSFLFVSQLSNTHLPKSSPKLNHTFSVYKYGGFLLSQPGEGGKERNKTKHLKWRNISLLFWSQIYFKFHSVSTVQSVYVIWISLYVI